MPPVADPRTLPLVADPRAVLGPWWESRQKRNQNATRHMIAALERSLMAAAATVPEIRSVSRWH